MGYPLRGGIAVPERDPVTIQNYACSRADCARLLSLDQTTISEPTAPRIHQEARFLYVRNGRGTIRLQGDSYELGPDTLLSILPWQIFAFTQVQEPLRCDLLIYDLAIFSRFIHSFRDIEGHSVEWLKHLEEEPVLRCEEEQAQRMRSYFESLREELGLESMLPEPSGKPLGTLWAINRALELMIQAERLRAAGGAQAPHGRESGSELRELLRYMYLHTSEKLTVGDLAWLFRVSEQAVRDYIKRVTGLGFYDLLNEMRLGKICGCLLNTDLTLDEIASLFGYADTPHLSKTFSDLTGMRISEYRRAYRSVESLCQFERAELAYSIIQYIYRHYSEPISITETARRFGVSPREVNRLLLMQAEKNFSELLNTARIDMACRLMLTTDHTMTYISVEVGYANVKTFNRNFLRYKGMPPGHFRKSVSLGKPDLGGEDNQKE